MIDRYPKLVQELLNLREPLNWAQISIASRRIVGVASRHLPDPTGTVETVVDKDGVEVPPLERVVRLDERLRERLTPSELFEAARAERDRAENERRRAEDERAEERLCAYFFPNGLWEALPTDMRRALIEADRSWVSTRVGTVELTLDHLQNAAERLCHELFSILAAQDFTIRAVG